MSRSARKVVGGASDAPVVGDTATGVADHVNAKVKAARKPRGVTKPRYFFVDRGGVFSLVRAAGKKEAFAMAVGDVMIRLATPEDIMAVVKTGGPVLGVVSELFDDVRTDAADAATTTTTTTG